MTFIIILLHLFNLFTILIQKLLLLIIVLWLLQKKELEVLDILCKNINKNISYEYLKDIVWINKDISDSTVRDVVSRLKRS